MSETENILAQTKPKSNGEATAEAATDSQEGPSQFDPKRLRLTQDFASSLGVKKTLLTVPVRKPAKEWFVRTHPDEEYRLQTAVLELKEDHETYLIEPSLLPELADEPTVSPRALFTAVSRQGAVFLWPVRLPGIDGKIDDWSRSALEAAQMAADGWVRVAANMHVGAYDVYTAPATLSDPVWPDTTFGKLLEVAFKDKFISSLDHPVLQRLRGEK